MAMTLPRPTSAFSGPLLEIWQLVQAGHIRRAASMLAAASRRDLTRAEEVQHASLLLTCRLAGGDLPGATVAATQLEPHVEDGGPSAVLSHLGHAEIAAAAGDHQRALDHCLLAGKSPAADDPGLAPWRSGAALAQVRLGHRSAATALVRDLLAEEERSNDRWRLAIALRTAATVDAAADALSTLQRARTLALASGDRRLAAQVDTDLAGLLLLRPGADPAPAVALLRSAEAYAAAEALWPLHSRVSRLLERTGERTRPLRDEAVALLTPGEQRVARLAARGLTNRQIAEHLAVTIKGVEWHLSRIYRKLGIASRDDLGPLLKTAGDELGSATA